MINAIDLIQLLLVVDYQTSTERLQIEFIVISVRSWEGWFESGLGGHEMIVPEVSRVARRPIDGQNGQQLSELLLKLFNRRRAASKSAAQPALSLLHLTKLSTSAQLEPSFSHGLSIHNLILCILVHLMQPTCFFTVDFLEIVLCV